MDIVKRLVSTMASDPRAHPHQVLLIAGAKPATDPKKLPKAKEDDVLYGNAQLHKNPKKMVAPPKVDLEVKDKAVVDRNLAQAREHVVDAAIVRVMKARRTLRHAELQAEVLRMCNLFQAAPAFIKRRIESLIEREYLERDATDRATYKYLA